VSNIAPLEAPGPGETSTGAAAAAARGTLQAFAEVARRHGVETTPEQLRRSWVFGEADPVDGVLIRQLVLGTAEDTELTKPST